MCTNFDVKSGLRVKNIVIFKYINDQKLEHFFSKCVHLQLSKKKKKKKTNTKNQTQHNKSVKISSIEIQHSVH